MKLKKAKDNEMLEAEITDEEVRESLKTSNKKAVSGATVSHSWSMTCAGPALAKTCAT